MVKSDPQKIVATLGQYRMEAKCQVALNAPHPWHRVPTSSRLLTHLTGARPERDKEMVILSESHVMSKLVDRLSDQNANLPFMIYLKLHKHDNRIF